MCLPIQQNCIVPDFLGVPAFLVLAVTGLAPDEEASFSHVTLLGADGERLQLVKLNSSSSSSYSVEELVGWVDSVPRVPFCVQLTGQDSRGNKLERVSTEMVQPTHFQIQVVLMLSKTCAAFWNVGQDLKSTITGNELFNSVTHLVMLYGCVSLRNNTCSGKQFQCSWVMCHKFKPALINVFT